MVEMLLLASKALIAAAGCGAGLRLAQRARRATDAPLDASVSALMLVGGIGLVGFGMGPALAEESASLARGVMLASDALERLAMLLLAVFVWQVFGSGSPFRAILLSASLVGMTAAWTYVLLVQRWPEPMLDPRVQAASQLAFAAPFAWATLECGLARRRLLGQLALGLSDRAGCNRALLWALGCGAMAASCLAAALQAFLPEEAALRLALTGLRAMLYTAVSLLAGLSFFPPAGYRRWVEGGDRPAAGGAPAGGSLRRAALLARRAWS
jgi:hypothetical protein